MSALLGMSLFFLLVTGQTVGWWPAEMLLGGRPTWQAVFVTCCNAALALALAMLWLGVGARSFDQCLLGENVALSRARKGGTARKEG